MAKKKTGTPADRKPVITFHPGMRGGSPTISGTRLPITHVLEAMWGDSVQHAIDSYQCSREQCLVAAWFAGTYGIDDYPANGRNRGGVWRKRYGAWVEEHGKNLWAGLWDKVPDPPNT